MSEAPVPPTLPFKVAPSLLQDLGVNLYTKLDAVLTEFIANAHDADADFAKVSLNLETIKAHRNRVKSNYQIEKANAGKDVEIVSLESRTLGEDAKISIFDNGCGMSWLELRDKFLMVSRKRREADQSDYTPKGRAIMGRKGLGKLAGFGVAHKIVVTSKKADSPTAWRIDLDYDQFRESGSTDALAVPLTEISDVSEFEDGQGTIVELSKLVYSSYQFETTIENSIARNFRTVGGFQINIDKKPLAPFSPDYAFAFPKSETGDTGLVDAEIHIEEQGVFTIRYRIYFRGAKQQLRAHERGVRVYCRNRLSSNPDLFGINTSSNGYMYHSYLEGVVEADYIDEQKVDYIATNRQGMRWENPLLAPLHQFIKEKIVASLNEYDAFRREESDRDTNEDALVNDLISEGGFSGKRKTQVKNLAKVIAKGDSDGVKGEFYKNTLPIVVRAFSHGDIMSTISQLANDPNPQMQPVIQEIAEITKAEYGSFVGIAEMRLKGIDALKTIIRKRRFNEPHNEKELQKLLEQSPWLIDPTFFQFFTANSTEDTLFLKLGERLEIGTHANPKHIDATVDADIPKNTRPDLTFILGNVTLQKIIIIELKSPNGRLTSNHLDQLITYMDDAERWLKDKLPQKNFIVKGYLIGTRATSDTESAGVKLLGIRENMRSDKDNWTVLDLEELMDQTKLVHQDFVNAAKHRNLEDEFEADASTEAIINR